MYTSVSEAWLPNDLCLSWLQAAVEAFSILRAFRGSPTNNPHPQGYTGHTKSFLQEDTNWDCYVSLLLIYPASSQTWKKLNNLRDRLCRCLSLAEDGQ